MNGISERSENMGRGFSKDFTKKSGPVSYGWFGLGPGRGIKWTLWPNSVVFSRQEKQGDKWLTTEELHVAPTVLKEIAWRVGHWLASIEKNGRKNYSRKTTFVKNTQRGSYDE